MFRIPGNPDPFPKIIGKLYVVTKVVQLPKPNLKIRLVDWQILAKDVDLGIFGEITAD